MKSMEEDVILGKMGGNIQVIGRIVKCTERERWNGLINEFIKVVAERFRAHDFNDGTFGFIGQGFEDAVLLIGSEPHFTHARAFFFENFFETVNFGGDAGV